MKIYKKSLRKYLTHAFFFCHSAFCNPRMMSYSSISSLKLFGWYYLHNDLSPSTITILSFAGKRFKWMFTCRQVYLIPGWANTRMWRILLLPKNSQRDRGPLEIINLIGLQRVLHVYLRSGSVPLMPWQTDHMWRLWQFPAGLLCTIFCGSVTMGVLGRVMNFAQVLSSCKGLWQLFCREILKV